MSNVLQAHVESIKWRNKFYIFFGNGCKQDVSSLDNCSTHKDKPPMNYFLSKVYNVEAPAGKNGPENILTPRIQTNDWLMKGVKIACTMGRDGNEKKQNVGNIQQGELKRKYQKILNQKLELKLKFKMSIPI